jgi:hypothetical protein
MIEEEDTFSEVSYYKSKIIDSFIALNSLQHYTN